MLAMLRIHLTPENARYAAPRHFTYGMYPHAHTHVKINYNKTHLFPCSSRCSCNNWLACEPPD